MTDAELVETLRGLAGCYRTNGPMWAVLDTAAGRIERLTAPDPLPAFERLLCEADTCQHFTLTRLADAAEEEGSADAPGWRWLADNDKWPTLRARGRWVWGGYGRTGSGYSDGLPEAVVLKLRERLIIGCDPGRFPSRWRALSAAAFALSDWLRSAPQHSAEG